MDEMIEFEYVFRTEHELPWTDSVLWSFGPDVIRRNQVGPAELGTAFFTVSMSVEDYVRHGRALEKCGLTSNIWVRKSELIVMFQFGFRSNVVRTLTWIPCNRKLVFDWIKGLRGDTHG